MPRRPKDCKDSKDYGNGASVQRLRGVDGIACQANQMSMFKEDLAAERRVVGRSVRGNYLLVSGESGHECSSTV